MTEQEAKTKWCPLGKRYIADEFNMGAAMTAINEPEGDYRQSCIASDCMMWQEQFRKVTEADVEACDLFEVGDMNMPDGGYCGLAGK